MIAEIECGEEAAAARRMVASRPLFRSLMGRDLALWPGNPGAPVRLYRASGAVLAVTGASARLCGVPEDGEELLAFLRFAGVERVLAEHPPAGAVRRALYLYRLAAGGRLPVGAPPAGLRLERSPSMGAVAALCFPDRPARRDAFYSESCTALAHGMARVVALCDGAGRIVSTVGAYAIAGGEAYLAMGETVEEARGRGIGGWLIPTLANEMSGAGWDAVLLCEEKRRHFYGRLGFSPAGIYGEYAVN